MHDWIVILVVAWLAATISGAAGFGGALLLLPILIRYLGAEAAVPVLAVAQIMGNGSRAAFGFRVIRWREVAAFSVIAVPATCIGAILFVKLPSDAVLRAIGIFLLFVVLLRHTRIGSRPMKVVWLPAAGGVVGFLSGVVGSAGPLGAAAFLSLRLTPLAYVASEAVTALLIHATKVLVYSRYALVTWTTLGQGVLIGCALVIGSWTGRLVIGRLPDKQFSYLVEGLLVVAGFLLIFG